MAKEYTTAEVAKHNSEEDCWLVIAGHVYDVSAYLDDHPGGPEIVLDHAGTDATTDFEDLGHSDDAKNIMKKYLKGTVKGYDAEAAKAAAADSATESSGNGAAIMAVLLVLLAIAAAVMSQ